MSIKELELSDVHNICKRILMCHILRCMVQHDTALPQRYYDPSGGIPCNLDRTHGPAHWTESRTVREDAASVSIGRTHQRERRRLLFLSFLLSRTKAETKMTSSSSPLAAAAVQFPAIFSPLFCLHNVFEVYQRSRCPLSYTSTKIWTSCEHSKIDIRTPYEWLENVLRTT